MFKKILFAALALLLVPHVALASSWMYRSASGSELAQRMMLTNGKTLVYSVPIADIAVGDILTCGSELLVTNDNANGVRIAAQLFLVPSATATAGTALDWLNDTNVGPRAGEHHHVVVKTCGYKSAVALPAAWVVLVINGDADNLLTTAFLSIGPGNGGLWVKKERN